MLCKGNISSYLQVVPIVSIVKFSFHEHLLKSLEADIMVRKEEPRVMEVRDAGIHGISADIDNLAALVKDVWRQH